MRRAGRSPKPCAGGPIRSILFDEVEKAHPDVFNVLLQVLDDGRLTDGQGRTVDFKNTLIILTSNLGSRVSRQSAGGRGFERGARSGDGRVRAHFRPEFLNRLDEIILFHRLTRQQMNAIVDIQLERLRSLLEDTQDQARARRARRQAWLAERGYDPVYGARPLKRVIQRQLQDPLAELILAGQVKDGDKVKICGQGRGLTINGERVEAEAA